MPLASELISSRFKMPGFGLPLNFLPDRDIKKEIPGRGELFKNALVTIHLRYGTTQLPLTTLRELTMLDVMNQLSDKPDWHLKVFDTSITSKWKAEALATDECDITEKMIDWCIDELQYKAKVFEATGSVAIYRGDVVKSDIAIPSSLKERLRNSVSSLEQVPAHLKDWHPGSNEQVLDLVHPSLFPFVYGCSRVLPDGLTTLADFVESCGQGVVASVPQEEEAKFGDGSTYYGYPVLNKPFSRKFQWLPCDVDISSGKVRITSYINNLHPHKHADLYKVIEEIITLAIPLWNMTLTPLIQPPSDLRIVFDNCVYDPDPEDAGPDEGPQQEPDEDKVDFFERREEWIKETRRVVLPEPGTFEPPSEPKDPVSLISHYGQQGLQIIVKLANIHLTPENPEYSGGSWHVEGQLNEHICATGIYYYDSVNVSASQLVFRQQADVDGAADINYRLNQHDWFVEVYGSEVDSPAVQEVGMIDTREGRLLTWPNILQHRVQPFRLVDETRPGHRKILALFLVDPNIRIISTANVPCQRKDWWMEAISQRGGPISDLPVELQEQISDEVDDFPLGLEEAKRLQLELIEERKAFVYTHTNVFEANGFSLCEH